MCDIKRFINIGKNVCMTQRQREEKKRPNKFYYMIRSYTTNLTIISRKYYKNTLIVEIDIV